MESIFQRLSYWTNKNPQKLLYSFLDLNGQETQSYTYEEFLHRTRVIAGHLCKEHKLSVNDRVLLAFPPGLEMICAFIACARAGLIPVPVYPPTSYGFQAALYKMLHIARDCQAVAVLTSQDYYSSLDVNLTGSRMSTSSLDIGYILSLKWIVTEDFVDLISEENFDAGGEILFLQYTSGSTSNPKGVMVTHSNILHNCDLVVDHSSPVAVSWLPQYHDMGLIGYYLFSAFLTGGTTYGFSPIDFIQRPALWLDTIKKYRATGSSAPNFAFEYCLRPGRLSKETLENADLSSLRFLMAAAEPIKPDTYLRFLQMFQPSGLKPKYFFVAYGLAENTLAISNYGRNVLSINKKGLALGKVKVTTEISEIGAAKQIISCGHPLGDITVKIVDPENQVVLKDGNVGEIWVSGRSKCLGYWNNPELTQTVFRNRIIGDEQHDEYLRTGDMGFFYQGELYVCGRAKDMIIIRGQNYYPQDIENIVENASDMVRKERIAAFEIYHEHNTTLAVIAEVKNKKSIPEPMEIVVAIRNYLNVEIGLIAFIAPRQIPRTSSGKIMRHMVKQMWMEGRFSVLQSFSRETHSELLTGYGDAPSPFEMLKARYNLTGNEPYTLIEAGLDSLDIVIFMHEVKELLKDRQEDWLARQVDIKLIQQVSIADLFRLADQLEHSQKATIEKVRYSLNILQEQYSRSEKELMQKDSRIMFNPATPVQVSRAKPGTGLLLTGGTGFLGPFLLKSLLEQVDERVYVLIRARDESHGKERLRAAIESIGDVDRRMSQEFKNRVVPVCGDLDKVNLGLTATNWKFLANNVHTIYHNGASVNYLFNYARMKSTNVVGTNEILRLAFENHQKIFNYISTTFIFGWAVKEVLYETDTNENMELLDFGYSQSKWVAEQLVMDAGKRGLMTRIFRPALITPSINGGGDSFDIAIRLLAFMVNHGIGVEAFNQVSFMPADVVSNNIVAISNSTETVNQTFHVTRDDYANMVDITNIITVLTGREFELYKLPLFVPEVIKRCTRDDLLFPLLDFLTSSIDNISSMEFKRYDSSRYQKARNNSPRAQPDPSLENTVAGILRFMQRKGIISIGETDIAAAINQNMP